MNGFESLLATVEERPLSRSLPTVLSVAGSIGATELASWAKLELMGYFASNPAMRDDVVVPIYRTVVGSWYDDYGRMLVLPQADLSFMDELRLRQGVAELEGLATATGPLAVRARDHAALIGEALKVEVTTFEFEARSVAQVLTNIKVQLLDQLCAQRAAIAALPASVTMASSEIIQLKPGIYGISVELKALWRRLFGGKD